MSSRRKKAGSKGKGCFLWRIKAPDRNSVWVSEIKLLGGGKQKKNEVKKRLFDMIIEWCSTGWFKQHVKKEINQEKTRV